jgi:hypothetical protein
MEEVIVPAAATKDSVKVELPEMRTRGKTDRPCVSGDNNFKPIVMLLDQGWHKITDILRTWDRCSIMARTSAKTWSALTLCRGYLVLVRHDFRDKLAGAPHQQ